MNREKNHRCCKCNKQLPLKKLKKLNDGFYCSKCRAEKRKENRLKLKEELFKEGIMKRRTKKELPKIKPTKEKQKEINKKQIRNKLRTLYIDKNEKNVLYKTFKNKGFNSDESNERIKKLDLQMEITREKLKNMNLKEDDLNKRFLKEYNKLIETSTR